MDTKCARGVLKLVLPPCLYCLVATWVVSLWLFFKKLLLFLMLCLTEMNSNKS